MNLANSLEKNEKSVQVVLEFPINAPVSLVFPLCCPVEEYRWIPGWKCNLVHCPNDRVEKGTVFKEILSAPFLLSSFIGKTTWTAVLHDKENYRVHFKLENKISTSLYKIELTESENDHTTIKLDLTYRAVSPKAIKLIRHNQAERIRIMLTLLSHMLRYYSENKRMMRLSELQKFVIRERCLSITDKILMALNRIAMSLMPDKNRARFLRNQSS